MSNAHILGRFVKVSHDLSTSLQDQKLELIDVYTYSYLKSMSDKTTESVTTSLLTFSTLSGVAVNTAKKSFARLKAAKYIEYKAIQNKSTTYKFVTNVGRFEMVFYTVLRDTELSPYEKAYLICLLRFVWHDKFEKDPNPLFQSTLMTPTAIAKEVQLSLSTATRYTNALVAKNYLLLGDEVDSKGKKLRKIWTINYELFYYLSEKINNEYAETVKELKKEIENTRANKVVYREIKPVKTKYNINTKYTTV